VTQKCLGIKQATPKLLVQCPTYVITMPHKSSGTKAKTTTNLLPADKIPHYMPAKFQWNYMSLRNL